MKGQVAWPRSTCTGCAWSHVSDTPKARRISCRAQGGRAMPLDVQWCNRYTPEGVTSTNYTLYAHAEPMLISDKPDNPTGVFI